MKNPLLNKKGESLVEVVSSCAIFGILIAMATTVLMSSIDITAKSSRVSKGDGQISEFYDGNGATAPTPTATAGAPSNILFNINFSTDTGTPIGLLEGNLTVTDITPASGGVPLKTVTVGTLNPIP